MIKDHTGFFITVLVLNKLPNLQFILCFIFRVFKYKRKLLGIGISLYFNEIKTCFGQGLVDQLVGALMTNNNQNLYIDKRMVSEWHIYGSSRIGIYQTSINMAYRNIRISGGTTTQETNTTVAMPSYSLFALERGAKRYELTNHLGNVLVVVTDKKTKCLNIEAYSSDFKTTTGGFTAGWSADGSGFTGPYSTVSNSTGRLKTDATVTYSGNRCLINTVIGKSYTFTFDLDMGNTTSLYVNARATNSGTYTGTNLSQILVNDNGSFALTFTATTSTTQLLFEKGEYGAAYFYIDNAKVQETNTTAFANYVADVVSATDYSPFGAPLAGRSYTASNTDYRFAFNGKEKDSEGMGGGGSTYDYGFRIYNAQLGRFLSVDPLAKSYPWNSPYSYAENDVISCVDLDGLEKWKINDQIIGDGSIERTYYYDPNLKPKIDENGNEREYLYQRNGITKSITIEPPFNSKQDKVGMEMAIKNADAVKPDVGPKKGFHTIVLKKTTSTTVEQRVETQIPEVAPVNPVIPPINRRGLIAPPPPVNPLNVVGPPPPPPPPSPLKVPLADLSTNKPAAQDLKNDIMINTITRLNANNLRLVGFDVYAKSLFTDNTGMKKFLETEFKVPVILNVSPQKFFPNTKFTDGMDFIIEPKGTPRK